MRTVSSILISVNVHMMLNVPYCKDLTICDEEIIVYENRRRNDNKLNQSLFTFPQRVPVAFSLNSSSVWILLICSSNTFLLLND